MSTVTERTSFYINGSWASPASDQMCNVINPSDESLIGRVPDATRQDMDAAINAARAAFDDGEWTRSPLSERIEAVNRIGEGIQQRANELIELIVREMGAPIGGTGAAGQVLGAPLLINTFTEAAKNYPWTSEQPAPFGDAKTVVAHEPVGVVGAIIPWNGPLMLALTKAVPALLAGCTVVLKPAPETALDSYILAEIIDAAGLPDGVINIVPGDGEVGEHLVSHPEIDKISFTGSTAVGRRIGAICGEQIKRVSLELGGKSAAIMLEDASLEEMTPALVSSGLGNNGQQCFALSRVLVPRSRYAEVSAALTSTFDSLKVGSALDSESNIGPLISEAQRARVESYVETAISEGADLLAGGKRPESLDKGFYFEPTLLGNVDNGSTIAQEEVFGPVVCLIPYEEESEAIAMANDSIFGLSGAVFTEDPERGMSIARQIRTGTFSINHFSVNIAAPFGGFKCSGIGREWGPEGIAAFTEIKSINLPG